jgi:glutamine amidotransferase
MIIGVIDYDAGNIASVRNSLNLLGFESVVSGDPDNLSACDKLILPGVGAFPAAMVKLKERGLVSFIKRQTNSGIPLLGICLGMQLLFDYGNEIERGAGLGLLPGEVRKIDTDKRLPHIGWNSLNFVGNPSPLLENVHHGDYVYFVHSYQAVCGDQHNLIAVTEYDGKIPAIVGRENVWGCQFHPEKSGDVGLNIYKNFCLST